MLGRKQSKYREVLGWLERLEREVRPKTVDEKRRMARVVRKGEKAFVGMRY